MPKSEFAGLHACYKFSTIRNCPKISQSGHLTFLPATWSRNSSVERASDWRSKGPWFDPGFPLDYKINPINPKENQSWIFIGRTDAEAETPILWPPDEKNWLTGKDPEAGKDGRQEEKGTTVDKMVGWHCWLNRYEFEWAQGDGDGQGSLACCSPWGCKKSDTTDQPNKNQHHACNPVYAASSPAFHGVTVLCLNHSGSGFNLHFPCSFKGHQSVSNLNLASIRRAEWTLLEHRMPAHQNYPDSFDSLYSRFFSSW